MKLFKKELPRLCLSNLFRALCVSQKVKYLFILLPYNNKPGYYNDCVYIIHDRAPYPMEYVNIRVIQNIYIKAY